MSVAQTDCSNFVEKATELYNQGKYDECTSLIESTLIECPSIIISKSTKENAYILLINSYIEKDSFPAVEANFKKLLKNNPAFKIRDYTGLDDFKVEYKNYYTLPRVTIGARVHYSKNEIITSTGYTTKQNFQNNAQDNVLDNSNKFGFSIMGELRPTKRIGLFAEYGHWRLEYTRNISTTNWSLKLNEKTSYAQLDLGMRYYFRYKRKLNFYLSSGLNNQVLLKSKIDIGLKEHQPTPNNYTNVDEGATIEKNEFDYDSKNIRAPIAISPFIGYGILYRFGKTGVGFDYRFAPIGTTINNKKNRFSEPMLVERLGYIDNDMRLSRRFFSIQIVYMFNQVKQKNK